MGGVALPPTKSLPHESLEWDFPIRGVPYFGVLIIRILLFRVLH